MLKQAHEQGAVSGQPCLSEPFEPLTNSLGPGTASYSASMPGQGMAGHHQIARWLTGNMCRARGADTHVAGLVLRSAQVLSL